MCFVFERKEASLLYPLVIGHHTVRYLTSLGYRMIKGKIATFTPSF